MKTEKKSTILITGATGNIGTELAKKFAAMGVPFRAMVRSMDNIGSLGDMENVEIVTGDFNAPESMRDALAGIEHAFLLTNSSEHAEAQQIAFVDAAVKAQVKHIVKLSQFAASKDSPVRFLRYHAAVEEKIKASGLQYTFLRPNLFMQGLLGFHDPIVYQGKLFAPAGNAKVSIVDIRDIAAVAATALTEDGHENKTYTLTGPEALTHQQLASYLSIATDRVIQYIDVTPEDMEKALESVGFPRWQIDGLLEDYAHYSRGEAAEISESIKKVTGSEPHDFMTFAKDYASAFSK